MDNLGTPHHNRWENAEQLVEAAGTAPHAPPLPPGGIPKQWLPGWIRWPLRVIVLPFVWLDLATRRLALKVVRPPYRQEGHCLQRGNCCYYILLPKPKGAVARLFYFWFTQVNGFFLRTPKAIESEGQEMHVMGCRYLKDDGRCAHYRLRPMLCRQWPLIEYFGYPRRLKGCGFYAVKSGSMPGVTQPDNDGRVQSD